MEEQYFLVFMVLDRGSNDALRIRVSITDHWVECYKNICFFQVDDWWALQTGCYSPWYVIHIPLWYELRFSKQSWMEVIRNMFHRTTDSLWHNGAPKPKSMHSMYKPWLCWSIGLWGGPIPGWGGRILFMEPQWTSSTIPFSCKPSMDCGEKKSI